MLPQTKVIDLHDFSNAELLPYLEEIARDEQIRFGLDAPQLVPDSKQWECAMMLRAFEKHGVLEPGRLFAGIGAGIEQTTFALAARGCVAFPSDRYLEATPWSDVAPASMMMRPHEYTSLSIPKGSVIPVHGDARSIPLPSNFFDGVYSAGSIEHFGSLEAVAAEAEEIGRILKPGGIATISTEFRLDGPNDQAWFDDNCILFTPELIEDWIVKPSGLELSGSVDIRTPSDETFDSRVVLMDFLARSAKVGSIEEKRTAYPNLVLFHEGFLFCSVHLALTKGANQYVTGHRSSRFDAEIDATNLAAAQTLIERTIGGARADASAWLEDSGSASTLAAQPEGTELLRSMLQSRSWRMTAPVRAASSRLRQSRLFPLARGLVRALRWLKRRLF